MMNKYAASRCSCEVPYALFFVLPFYLARGTLSDQLARTISTRDSEYHVDPGKVAA